LEEVVDIYQEGIRKELMNTGEGHFADTTIKLSNILPLTQNIPVSDIIRVIPNNYVRNLTPVSPAKY
jgi:hypothetical protein